VGKMMDTYEVVAIRYATRVTSRREAFYRYESYREPDAPLRMDYYFWLLRSPRRVALVDTGFDPEVGRRRGRTLLVEPLRALDRLGVRPPDVAHVIVTHLHYDHIGNLAAFPRAEISVPRPELEFWTGPYASRPQFAEHVEAAEVAYLDAAWREGRARAVDDGQEILPGIRAHLVGGHSPGQQVTVVAGAGGSVVLASDAIHYEEEMERDMPFAIFSDLAGMYRGYDRLRELRDRERGVVVAGHDPAVVERFPGLGHDLEGLAVRLG
jgi:glyoxylase-like metal-dependent hydrolase (beta-lactamase superfamily II)